MKRFIISLLVLFASGSLKAQPGDTTITFRVRGVCIQCKQRIEGALQVPGIRTANWVIASNLLTVNFLPSKISQTKINDLLTGAGHDTETQQATDEDYNTLPSCCRYRELRPMNSLHDPSDSTKLYGVVVEKIGNSIKPLEGATITFPGVKASTVTNQHGEFYLSNEEGKQEVIVSYTGFRTDTISTNGLNDIQVTLSRKGTMENIVVSARLWGISKNSLDPFGASMISGKELLKAACCNLSESFETNPAVDVSYNDAITGSKQIQLLGLAGIYTQLTVENMPGPRGLATPLGLNTIPGPWVESMQLIKGSGSVVNGFESIAGQINVELRKPDESEKLYVNGYTNTMGKTDFNVNLAHKLSEKWSAMLMLHDDFLFSKQDFNKDGFRDLPTGNQFSSHLRFRFLGDKGLMAQFGFKALVDEKTGGQLAFEKKQNAGGDTYGLGINTDRYEGFMKIGYVNPKKVHQSVGLQLSAFDHRQRSFFGRKVYNADQQNLYANLIFQTQLGSEKHTIKGGLSLVDDKYDELVDSLPFQRKEVVAGIFSEYVFHPSDKLDLVAGMRLDHNNLYGWFATPRINIRYAPVKTSIFRFSVGRGQRTANIFAENMASLVSARIIMLLPGTARFAYGLKPEVAWNKGVSFDQHFMLFDRKATATIDYFRNDFVNQVVVNIENPRQIRFENLDGKSFSNSFQVQTNISPVKNLDVRLAYRYYDVRTTYGGKLLTKPFTSKHRGFLNLGYSPGRWSVDYTMNLVGSKRIPGTDQNPAAYQLDDQSPAYVTMNAQVSYKVGKGKIFEVYAGGENLTNYFQKTTIIAADAAFSPYFDASMIWGPVSGRMFYTGFRYTLK